MKWKSGSLGHSRVTRAIRPWPLLWQLAASFQLLYRGHKVRQRARKELLQQWLRDFGGAAASQAATVPASTLSGMPLFLSVRQSRASPDLSHSASPQSRNALRLPMIDRRYETFLPRHSRGLHVRAFRPVVVL